MSSFYTYVNLLFREKKCFSVHLWRVLLLKKKPSDLLMIFLS